MPELTTHDKVILGCVFNPEHPNDDLDGGDTIDGKVKTEDDYEGISKEILIQIKENESKAVKLAEMGDLLAANEMLSTIIQKHPTYYSAYNNRAQVYQLQADKKSAFSDLNQAIHLSKGKGNVACQAFTQRGILNKAEDNIDAALADFRKASELGGKFARQMLVEMNPYAALCNQMLDQVFKQLTSGQSC